MHWIFYVQMTLAAVCWFFMGIYVYERIKEIRNGHK